jgi:hypothetical protein
LGFGLGNFKGLSRAILFTLMLMKKPITSITAAVVAKTKAEALLLFAF